MDTTGILHISGWELMEVNFGEWAEILGDEPVKAQVLERRLICQTDLTQLSFSCR